MHLTLCATNTPPFFFNWSTALLWLMVMQGIVPWTLEAQAWRLFALCYLPPPLYIILFVVQVSPLLSSFFPTEGKMDRHHRTEAYSNVLGISNLHSKAGTLCRWTICTWCVHDTLGILGRPKHSMKENFTFNFILQNWPVKLFAAIQLFQKIGWGSSNNWGKLKTIISSSSKFM